MERYHTSIRESAAPLPGRQVRPKRTANQRSKVAEYQPNLPIAMREDAPMRIVFVAAEEFTHSGGGSTGTFNLSYNVVERPNAAGLVLYDDGAQVQPDSVNYAGDRFDYTDSEASTLHAFYVAKKAGTVEVEVTAPRAQGGISKVVYDDVTEIFAQRDQNKEPLQCRFTLHKS